MSLVSLSCTQRSEHAAAPGRILFCIGMALVALCLAITGLGNLRDHIPPFLALYGLTFILYTAAIWFVSGTVQASRSLLISIFLVGALGRVALLVGQPTLSDDLYRYLWDGRVLHAGINPFQYPPDHPNLEFLRDTNYAGINHKQLNTIYPPLAQFMFWTVAGIAPDPFTLKLVVVLFDLGTLGMVCLLLLQRNKNPAMCVVYAWNPLVMVEYAHSGHMDSLAMFFLVLGAWLVVRGHPGLGISSLAYSGLSKYFSAVLIPYFLFNKRYWAWIGLYPAILTLGYMAFIGSPSGLVSSLYVYATQWEFNSMSYVVLSALIGDQKLVRGLLFAAWVGFSCYQGYRQPDLLRYIYIVIGFMLLLTPTLHPWYVCWIVPFLCVFPNRAWIAFTGLAPISYWVWVHYAATGVWSLESETLLLEYVPFYGLLMFETFWNRRRLA